MTITMFRLAQSDLLAKTLHSGHSDFCETYQLSVRFSLEPTAHSNLLDRLLLANSCQSFLAHPINCLRCSAKNSSDGCMAGWCFIHDLTKSTEVKLLYASTDTTLACALSALCGLLCGRFDP